MASLERSPRAAARATYDLIIVGGGIYGAMLSLEASRRGLRSLLVERDDFGGATSFNSHRILHGGVRYLQDLDWRRTRESVRARRWFLRHFPELARPLPCLMPLYGAGLRRPEIFRAALRLNDRLSWDRNEGVRPDRRIPPGAVRSAAETACLFPLVDAAGLRGGAVWYDASVPDSQRLLIEVLRWSASLGATALNYVEATGLLTSRVGVRGIMAQDRESGDLLEFEAGVVVNATGPWSRLTAARFDRDHEPLFHSSIAWCVLFDRDALSEYALAVAPKRPKAPTYFLHPWKGKILAGTGHAPWQGAPEDARPDAGQLGRFLGDVNDAIPGIGLREGEIAWIFSGLLPAGDAAGTTLASREVFLDHRRRGGPRGLYTLSGVKLTTAPCVAAMALERIFGAARGHEARGRSRPVERPALQDGWDMQPAELAEMQEEPRCGGARRAVPLLRRLIAEEAALHLDDLVLRRTTLWEAPSGALSAAPQLCALFGWDEGRCREEIRRLERQLGVR